MNKSKKVLKWEVVDFSLVPENLKLIDASKVWRLVQAGLSALPGIRIYSEDTLRVTPKKEA